jgi:cobaltochelatase CobN
MHLLPSEVALLEEADAAADLGHSPAAIVVLSFADGDLAALAEAWGKDGAGLPSLRLASLKKLRHPLSVDLYIEAVIAKAKAVVVRCLGGVDYWRYGLERIAEVSRARNILFAALPGDDRPDGRLASLSTVDHELLARLDACLRSGGPANALEALRLLAARLEGRRYAPPVSTLAAVLGVLASGEAVALAALAPTPKGRPVALVVLYRSALLAGDIAPISALMAALEGQGLASLAVAVTSLKDPAVEAPLARLFAAHSPRIIVNTTAFSALREDKTTVLDGAGVPVLQAVLAGSAREAWAASPRGLSPTDLAMNVALPELDGRLMSRAISFKVAAGQDPRIEFAAVRHEPVADRVAYVAELACAWVKLGLKPRGARRIAIVLADYPARAGRAGYAVGLDTAASATAIVADLADAGYATGGRRLGVGDVEALMRGRAETVRFALADYARVLARMPPALVDEMTQAWGDAAADPTLRGGHFELPVLTAGNVLILLQPDRGARAGRKADYHNMALPPRHAYVALYAWLREAAAIDALVHLGTHGTLEWLPGKALALSAACWPEVVLGALPVVYPFIVNNPGEAAQAKRRLGAVTIGHLTPPPGPGGLSGALLELEGLVEEYALAEGLDRRRVPLLEAEILERAFNTGLAAECGVARGEPVRQSIAKLDARLCDIKDLAVRGGLHVFGRAPTHADGAALAAAIAASGGAGAAGEDAGGLARMLAACAACERDGLIAALDAKRVAPGPAGAPTRGRVDVLPTGRNLSSLDPRGVPTRTAATIGWRAAEEVVRRHLQDHGEYPRALVLDLWASATLRTGGDDLAQALAYLGARPVWDGGSQRVTGIEVLALAKLGRPRIDATLRISGLFRDLFESQIALFDLAARRVAALEEDADDNPLAEARRRGAELFRVFGSAPGSYGAGAAAAALDGPWTARAELAEAYLAATTHAYGLETRAACDAFRARVAAADALVHPQDDRERDVLDGDGVADFAGGLAAAAAQMGRQVALYHLDTSRPTAPKARTLAEEVARVVRGRLADPRWIAAILAHGARGVAEIAQGVDALYAFAATAEIVAGSLFDLTHAALIAEEPVYAAMLARNPAAAGAIAARLKDALARGLWVARRNATARELDAALMSARARVRQEAMP